MSGSTRRVALWLNLMLAALLTGWVVSAGSINWPLTTQHQQPAAARPTRHPVPRERSRKRAPRRGAITSSETIVASNFDRLELNESLIIEADGLNGPPPGLERPRTSRGAGRARYDQPGEAVEFFRRKRLPEGETELPIDRYFTALDQMRQMPQYSTAEDRILPARARMTGDPAQQRLGAWTPLGPGNIGGRTRTLVIHPANPSVMYAAGVAGGVWKTTNGGALWTPIADLLANIAVNSMAMDPANPEIIYAGTGEGFFNIDAVRGAGVFKTADGGATWTQLEGTKNPNFYFLNDLVVSPKDSNRIYAATSTGVWRSTDGGVAWTRVLDPAISGGCFDLAARTDQQTDYLFAACGTAAGVGSGTTTTTRVYRNTDAAGAGQWASVLSESGMSRTSLAIAPSNQDVVYALAASGETGARRHGLFAVFRSVNGGDPGTWTPQTRNTSPNKINRSLLSNTLIAFLTNCGLDVGDALLNQGWYDNVIAVDPANENIVWAGGIDLFRSNDGGANWGVASYWWTTPGTPSYAHADQHAIVFHPRYDGAGNRTMFVASDGGLFRTEDARAPVATDLTGPCNPANSSVPWISLNNGYGVTQFYHGLPYPDGASYFGGTQDNGTLRGNDTDGAGRWSRILGGDGGVVAINPDNPSTLFAANTDISMQKTTDGGATFGSAISGIADLGLFIHPYVMDQSDPQRLWTGGLIRLWRTTNGAARWEAASNFIAGSVNSQVSSVAIAPADANYALAGLTEGHIHLTNIALTSTSSTSWSFTQPRFGYVSWVAFDPTNKNIAYATYSTFGGTHVWRSINAGATWTGIDGAGEGRLPDVPVHSIVVDPSNTSRLYIGTDLGVFVSTNGGASWAVENTGFANVIVESLSLNVVSGVTTLHAFTHGRGVWKVTANMSGCNFALSPATQSVAASGGTATVNVTAQPGGCNWTATSNASWITASGSGASNGAANISVAANTGVTARAGTVTVGGRSFTVTQAGVVDTTAPAVAIISPASSGTFTTTAGSISLSGTASDNVGVASVTWASDRGGSGTATGTSSWTINNIALFGGVNNITVTARDASGNPSSATLAVTSTPEYSIATVAGTGTSGFSGDGGAATAARLSLPFGVAVDGSGDFYVADRTNHRIRKVTASTGVISTVAGTGTAGSGGDGGPATAAQLNNPSGVVVDSAGGLYIADSGNHRIRKVAAGVGVISTVAGTGTAGSGGDGGAATVAQLNFPIGMAVDGAGNPHIADFNNHRIRKITISTGVISTVAGAGIAGFSGDGGAATAARLNFPYGLAADGSGSLYIADSANHRIRKVTAGTAVISTVAGTGIAGFSGDEGPATAAQLRSPTGVAVAGAGNIFVVDRDNHRIRRITAAGVISTAAGAGTAGFNGDGRPANTAQLSSPVGVTVDSAGNLYLADSVNQRIRKITPLAADSVAPAVAITTPTSAATFTTATGLINLGGTASDNVGVAQIRWRNNRGSSGAATGTTAWSITNIPLLGGLNNITVTAWDARGNSASATLAVTHNPEYVISTLAGAGISGSSGDGAAAIAAQFFLPRAVAADGAGNVYIADTQNHRVRKVASNGVITAFAGNGSLGSSGDGGAATAASMNEPRGVAADAAGNVYIADTQNNRIRKAGADGVISTFAGTGVDDFGGDGGAATAAQLNFPIGVAVDAAGNVYIADAGNSRIRKVDTSGVISTVAGGGGVGFSGDGGAATAARLNFPAGVAVDGAGNFYVVDQGNQRVRKVNAGDGAISTIAGTGTAGFSGDGGAARSAQLNEPRLIAVDAAGNVYIADQANHRLRKITAGTGVITTIAGSGPAGANGAAFGGDGGAATAARMAFPTGVALDSRGNIYIADGGNGRIRRLSSSAAPGTVASVSAASFSGVELAAESIVAAFGTGLATATEVATTIPLPTTLAGTTVRVRDSAGTTHNAPLFFVAPGQINYLIPPGTANGAANVSVVGNETVVAAGAAQIVTVAPGLFAANANGQGVAAAVVFRRRADGSESFEPVAQFNQVQNRFVPAPINLGPETDQVFLLLYGTGYLARTSLSAATCRIGGVAAEVLFAGAAPGFVGLDQANVRLPRALAGRGEVDVVLTVDGRAANTVTVAFSGTPTP